MQVDVPGQDQAIHVSPLEIHQERLSAEQERLAGLLLHTTGYVVLKGAIPSVVLDPVREAFERIYQDCRASKEGEGWYQVARQTQAVFWERNQRWRIFPKLVAPLDSPWLLANPLVTPLLGLLLGEGYFCKFVSSDTCTRGALLQSPHRELGAGCSWEPRAYVVNVPLCSCGPANGPLEVWPGGSHLWRNALLERLGLNTDVQDGRNPDCEHFANLFPSRKVLLDPGDVLIRDPGLLHRGTVNHTDQPRSMLTLCYFRAGHVHDYGRVGYNLDRATWERLDPGVKSLFAHNFPSVEREDRPTRRWLGLPIPWGRRRSA